MTIFEVIRNNSLFGCLSDAEVNQALVFRSLNGADAYASAVHEKDVKLVSADLMMQLSAISSLKEGDLSIAYNSEQLKEMAQRIYDKYESKEESKPKGYKIIGVGVSFEQ